MTLAGTDPVVRDAAMQAMQAEVEAAIRPHIVEDGILVICPRMNIARVRV